MSNGIGGADAYTYIGLFLNVKKISFNIFNILSFNGTEPLFNYLMYFIRQFTDNYHYFFIIIYSIIIICYMKFYSKNIKDNKIIIITLLFIIPFISSFNLMRNSLAASLGLLAITSLKENKTIKDHLHILSGRLKVVTIIE